MSSAAAVAAMGAAIASSGMAAGAATTGTISMQGLIVVGVGLLVAIAAGLVVGAIYRRQHIGFLEGFATGAMTTAVIETAALIAVIIFH